MNADKDSLFHERSSIVAADSDFLDIANSRGAPPNVVWIEHCNHKTAVVEQLLRRRAIATCGTRAVFARDPSDPPVDLIARRPAIACARAAL